VIKILGSLLHSGGPIVDFPVVGRLVDESVILAELWLHHAVEILGGEPAQQKTVLQHSSLAGLVEQSGSLDVDGLSDLVHVGRDGDFSVVQPIAHLAGAL